MTVIDFIFMRTVVYHVDGNDFLRSEDFTTRVTHHATLPMQP